MITHSIEPITFPARPFSGGGIDFVTFNPSSWEYQPKVNGHRVMLHVPSGKMFNRQGGAYSNADKFDIAAAKLKLAYPDCTWLDCEAIGIAGNNKLGEGSMIVLDIVKGDRLSIHSDLMDRKSEMMYRDGFKRPRTLPAPSILEPYMLSINSVFVIDGFMDREEIDEEWYSMIDFNEAHGVTFFEGYVAKKIDSEYPIQRYEAERSTQTWVKHRFN